MRTFLFILLLFVLAPLSAQEQWSMTDGIKMQYEMQVSASNNQTSLWLNANKYGLSSLDKSNGYVRVALQRDIANDDKNAWGVGYGFDLALPYNYSTAIAIQQLFAELRYKAFTFSVGSKYRQMEMKNQRLSSGSQAFGINARPVPQLRVAVEDYWSLPYTHKWISVKGHFSYGYMTDGKWQKDFTNQQSKWTEGALYHSKAGYLRIGKESRPMSFELGLEMASVFGGTVNWYNDDKKLEVLEADQSVSAFWHAFIPGGNDFHEEEIGYKNVEGNQLGSWVARLNYKHRDFDIALYADHFFEDHSALYHLGYYGYGKDGDWQKRNHKLYLYPLKDGMIGIELTLKKQEYLKGVVVEFMNTRYQSGPIYHDHNATITDQIGGQDNYYNHTFYPGWQYYGQVIGNPLYLSPVNNEDGSLLIKDNRFFALHFGAEGNVSSSLSYRVLASWQKGFGTYHNPYKKPKENTSILAEMNYDFSSRMKGLSISAAYGFDKGQILGNNNGFQLTVRYEK